MIIDEYVLWSARVIRSHLMEVIAIHKGLLGCEP